MLGGLLWESPLYSSRCATPRAALTSKSSLRTQKQTIGRCDRKTRAPKYLSSLCGVCPRCFHDAFIVPDLIDGAAIETGFADFELDDEHHVIEQQDHIDPLA